MDTLVLVAFALLVLGVVGAVLPLLPSGLFSLAGVAVYWWHTGDPGTLLFALLVGLSLVAVAVDWLAGFVGAKAGGVDTKVAVVAGAVGFLLMLLTGPVGLLAGVAGTVFAFEFRESGDAEASARHAAYATVGVVASAAMQVLLTAVVLAAMLWVQFG
ncbi:DUF456 domain-containing protein [Halobacterium zhouii]|uniref:DUF456 domain-containing protein n=1 Tax=Halobacterium zhouii TaxID=2902624 RepID=UPI001E2A424E|nr:DUF456 domain-containing protein [Halobacterium zhouii]